jgi:hypothetical protein
MAFQKHFVSPLFIYLSRGLDALGKYTIFPRLWQVPLPAILFSQFFYNMEVFPVTEFLPEELNLIYLYDPGNLHGLIYELRSMMAVLMPDENELRNLAQGVITKLEKLTSADYKKLCETCSPEAALLHFNLGLEQELTETED